jgi:tetratricopeptide (TPR) repeat protein
MVLSDPPRCREWVVEMVPGMKTDDQEAAMRRSTVGAILVCVSLAVMGSVLAQAPPPPPGAPVDDRNAVEAAIQRRWQDPEGAAKALQDLMAKTDDQGTRWQCAWSLIAILTGRLRQYDAAAQLLLTTQQWREPPSAEWLASQWQAPSADSGVALAVAEKLVAAHPEARAAWVLLGATAGQAHKAARSVEAWEKAVALQSTPEARLRLAYAYLGAARYADALTAAKALEPLDIRARTGLVGAALIGLGQKEEAKKLADELAAQADLTWFDAQRVAAFYIKLGDREPGLALLKKAVEAVGTHDTDAKPEDIKRARASARISLARAYDDAGQAENAYQQYKLSATEGNEGAVDWLARHAADKLGDPAEFEALVAVCFAGRDVSAANVASEITNGARRAGKLKELEAWVVAALGKQPTSVPFLRVLYHVRQYANDRPATADAAARLYAADPKAVSAFQVASAYHYAGQEEKAAQFYELAPVLGWHESGVDELVACYKALGRMEKIADFAAQIRQSAGDALVKAYWEGDLWLAAGQPEKAVPLLEQAKGVHVVPWERTMARAYAATGHTEQACTAFEAALRAGQIWGGGDLAVFVSLLAKTYSPDQYVPRLAADLRTTSLPNADTLKGIWQFVADREREGDRLPELIAALNTACQAKPTDPGLWVGLGLAQLQAGQHDPATASLRKALDLDGTGALVRALEPDMRRARGGNLAGPPPVNFAQAQKEFQTDLRPALQASEMNRALEIALNYLNCVPAEHPEWRMSIAWQVARMAKEVGKTDEFAAACWERVQAHSADLGPVYLAVQCYSQADRVRDAVDLLESCKAEINREAILWQWLGSSYGKLGDVKGAERAYQHILEVDPNGWPLAIDLAGLYAKSALLPEAEKWADQGMAWIEAGGKEARVPLAAASCYASLGLRDKAVAALREAMDLAPASRSIYYSVGQTYKQLELWPQAVEVWRKALALDDKSMNTKIIEAALADAKAHGFE